MIVHRGGGGGGLETEGMIEEGGELRYSVRICSTHTVRPRHEDSSIQVLPGLSTIV